jgi:signal transduction histidine kinase
MDQQDALAKRVAAQDEELRHLRREFAQAVTQLEETQRRKSGLLAMAAHDLRTPLAIIQGYSQLLAADLAGDTDPAINEYLINIVAHADSLRNMVENLVALDQLEHGELRLATDRHDLNELVAQAVAEVEGLMMVKNVTIEHLNPSAPVWTWADEGQIRRALYNLLSHGIKYAHPGATLFIQADEKDAFGRVLLRDPARRIAPDVIVRLFDLVELEPDGAPSLRGMDLGLVLARRVAEAHGGRVAAMWEPERGTTLQLYLPAAE